MCLRVLLKLSLSGGVFHRYEYLQNYENVNYIQRINLTSPLNYIKNILCWRVTVTIFWWMITVMTSNLRGIIRRSHSNFSVTKATAMSVTWRWISKSCKEGDITVCDGVQSSYWDTHVRPVQLSEELARSRDGYIHSRFENCAVIENPSECDKSHILLFSKKLIRLVEGILKLDTWCIIGKICRLKHGDHFGKCQWILMRIVEARFYRDGGGGGGRR